MKTLVILFLTANSFMLSLTGNQQSQDIISKAEPIRMCDRNTNIFTQNKGQVSDQFHHQRRDVLFSGSNNGMVYHLRNNGISYQLNKVDSWKDIESQKLPSGFVDAQAKPKIAKHSTIYRLDIEWLNINKNYIIETEQEISSFDNYYLTTCPDGISEVKSFQGLTYKNIYADIDLHYYYKDGQLKYDYIVRAGADYSQIKMRVTGAEIIEINGAGELIFKTPLGEIRENAPLVLQDNKPLRAKWVIKNNNINFEIENANPERSFIIDPAVRSWGTYYGGTGVEYGYNVCADNFGNVYMTGLTSSVNTTVIATSGAFQTTIDSLAYSAFLVKFDNNGTRLWGTYYGQSGTIGWTCSCDLNGHVYMGGQTYGGSINSIATNGSYQSICAGDSDAFLVKFNSSGQRIWGTYYGDRGEDYGTYCSIDNTGNVYLIGSSNSATSTVLASVGSHQSSHGHGSMYYFSNSDAFLVKFNSSGIRQWATYYGDAGDDYGNSCATDVNGNVYIVGMTNSKIGTTIATPGSHQPIHSGGYYDAFLAKFSPNGMRQWATYYGGGGMCSGNSCSTDAFGNVFLSGGTGTNTLAVLSTQGSHQTFYGGGASDGLLVKFNSVGVRQWATYYGGAGNETIYSSSIDKGGNVYLSGYTTSNTGTVMATTGSHQQYYGGTGPYLWGDAYLVKFNSSGKRQWGSYYGGTADEFQPVCATNQVGNIYLVGSTASSNAGNLIATAGGQQTINAGGTSGTLSVPFDAFLAQFYDCAINDISSLLNLNICPNNATTLTAYSSSGVNWFSSPTSTLPLATGPTYITPNLSAGIYTFYAEPINCNSSPARISIMVNVTLSSVILSGGLICLGESFTLDPGGANSYTFSSGTSIVSPTMNTTYTVSGSGCQNNAVITVSVDLCTEVNSSLIETKTGYLIYPNPTNGEFFITTEYLDSIDLSIYDLLGKNIYSEFNFNRSSKIDISPYPQGMYLVEIKLGQSVSRIKLIKE